MVILILITILLFFNNCEPKKIKNGEELARNFMKNLNKEYAVQINKEATANWGYATNITQENLEKKVKASTERSKWFKEQWKQVISFPWQNFKDQDLKRQFKKYSILGKAALSEEKIEKLNTIVSEMQSIYSTAKICSFSDKNKCDLVLEPDLVNILAKSNNTEELKYVWQEWRNVSGRKVKQFFKEYVDLSNEAAVLNNFTDASELWLSPYEDENFRDEIQKIWEQIRPLYLQIHAYVRNKLRQKYGNIVPKDKLIPAHLLGNMWSQVWGNIYEQMIPYPDVERTHLTAEMVAQGYTPTKMFKTAEEFFISINMSAMPKEFWEGSIFEKPKDRDIICHASAYDFSNGKDFRIKQCAKVQKSHFYVAHHEMGHTQYHIQYKNLPIIYRGGANPGFHEAVGDVIALSVSTNKHLNKIGLLKKYVDTDHAAINQLLEKGLNKIAFLPYAYLMDLWRWNVFNGKITPENYNSEWWKLRNEYQGIEAPVPRSENDFDPGAKYHIIADVPYIRYFVSYVIQFQFHKALCEKAGQYEPNNPKKALHKCDIYQNVEAGNALKQMLQLGSSKPWHDAMETLTGDRNMDASALLEYFAPLQEWLIKENGKSGEYIGWKTI